MSLTSTVGSCPCSNTRTVLINLSSLTGPNPIGGYQARWRFVDAANNYGPWSEWGSYSSAPISITGVVSCCRVVGELRSSCGTGADGLPRYSGVTEWSIDPNVTVASVTFTQGSCNSTTHEATYTVQGIPGQSIRVRLGFSGPITHDTSVLNSGCAWIYGSIQARGNLRSAVTNTTGYGATQTLAFPDSLEITFTIPSNGSTNPLAVNTVNITTMMRAYNVLNPQNVVGFIKILAVDGVSVNTLEYPVTCVADDESTGCNPRLDSITP